MIIYHIISHTDWEQARAQGEYRPPSLFSEGFIHASTLAQLVETASRHYRGVGGLALLAVDTEKLKPELKWEPASLPGGAQDFPHIYGPLNLNAVIEVIDFPPEPDGAFALPAALRPRF